MKISLTALGGFVRRNPHGFDAVMGKRKNTARGRSLLNRSKYQPHQSEREKARRRRQMRPWDAAA